MLLPFQTGRIAGRRPGIAAATGRPPFVVPMPADALGLPGSARPGGAASTEEVTDLEVLVRSAREGGRRLDRAYFRELKKRLIERQAQGMLEFVEPRWGLDTVVGHEAAKRRLLDDAELIKRGELDTVPMG